MASLTETFDELVDNATYPGLSYDDGTFEINVLGDASLLEAIDGGGGDIWIRSFNDVWDPYDPSYGVRYHYRADDVTLTGSNIDQFNDLSGNGRDAPYITGTKCVQETYDNATVARFAASISEGYKATFTNDPNSEGFVHIFVFGGYAGLFASWALTPTDLGIQCGNLTEDLHTVGIGGGTITINDAAPYDRLAMSTWRFKESVTSGEGWLNGDYAGRSAITCFAMTNCNDYRFFGQTNQRFVELVTLISDVSLDVVQRWEGLIAWHHVGMHRRLPSDHPYRYFSPTGDISQPATPTVSARPLDGGAIVQVALSDYGGAEVEITVTSSPGGIEAIADADLVADFSGLLTNGVAYTFTAVARNIAGSATSSPSNSVTPTTLANGFVAQYKGDEASGNILSTYNPDYDLTITGSVGASIITDPVYPARTFSGTGQYARNTTPDIYLACKNTDFTISVWFYTTTTSGTRQFFSIRNTGSGDGILNTILRMEGTSLKLYTGNGTNNGSLDAYTITGSLAANTLYHVAAAYTKSTKNWHIRLNGGSVDSSYTSSYVPNGVLTVAIGGDTLELCQGGVGLVQIWNVAKSDADLLTMWNSGTPLSI